MTIDFIKQLHQNSLEKAWNARPAKPVRDPMLKRREKVMSRIDAALAQLESGEINPPRGIYQTRENFNGMRVQLKYGQRALTIDGRDHWFVEDAATFFRSAREAVGNGELDGAINDVVESKDKAKEQDTPPAAKSKPPGLEKVRTPEVAPHRNAGADEPRLAKPLALEKAGILEVAADDKASGDQAHAARSGRFAQKYEKLLAAGILSEPAL